MKKIFLILAFMFAANGAAFAQIDVNKADQAALDSIKGIGPSTSKAILEERKKAEFKDWADFESRVKGIGDKSAAKLSSAGLTVNGKPKSASAQHAEAKEAKKEKPKSASAKDGKAIDAKEVKPTSGSGRDMKQPS